MTWTFDAGEDIPFPSGTASGDGALLHSPAEPVTGLCRTTRISGLPHRYRGGLDDAPGNTVHAHAVNKRKVPPSDDQDDCRRVACKIKATLDCDASADGTTTELATEPAEDDYESIKAMADADHLVRMPLPSFLNLIIDSGCGLQTPGRAYC
jgi:hypothetical protein